MNNKSHTSAGMVCFVVIFSCATLMGLQDAVDRNRVPSDALEKPTTQQRAADRSFHESGPTFTPVELQPVATPITINLEADSRAIYNNIAKLTGLTVVFDEDYVSRSIRVDLHGVPLREALDAVAFESKTFWRPVTPSTIYVAADTMSKRRELKQSVIKVFSLPNHANAAEAQEYANTLRTILDITRVSPIAEGALVVRGTPDQIGLATKLVDDLVKARPVARRYRVEIRVSEIQGQTSLHISSYRLFLEGNEPQLLNIVDKVPAKTENQLAADDKGAQSSVVSQNIDCRITSESEHAVGLSVRGTFSDFSDGENPKQSGRVSDVRQFSVVAKPIIELDKPMVISSFDDPGYKHPVQIELVVTRLGGER